MNIAFPALLVFLIILPGSIFHFSYKTSEKSDVDQTPFASTFVKWVILAGILHSVWVAAAGAIGLPVDFNILLMLLTAPQRENSLVLAIESAARHFELTMIYFMTLFTGAALLGVFAKSLVARYRIEKWPYIGQYFKRDTPWYNLFTAHSEEFDIDGVVISAIVEVGKTGYIYTGLLKEYFFATDGTLDRIIIEMAMRRPITTNKGTEDEGAEEKTVEKESRFYKIPGDYFILRYSEIRTMNIEFIKLEDAPIEETLPLPEPVT